MGTIILSSSQVWHRDEDCKAWIRTLRASLAGSKAGAKPLTPDRTEE